MSAEFHAWRPAGANLSHKGPALGVVWCEPLPGNIVCSMSDIEQALRWWSHLSRDDKARWLQCAATPEEIDADLMSPDRSVREAAGIASVGDAWHVYRREDKGCNRL